MWIAACDDDSKFLLKFEKQLIKAASKDDKLTLYDSGLALIEDVNRTHHPIDVLFLDMDMPGFNGIELGHDLRRICPSAIIIVLTNFIQYAYESFEIKPNDYLLKPIEKNKLKDKINESRMIVNNKKRDLLHIKTRDYEIFLSCGDILYFESYKRLLYCHTRENIYKFYKTIREQTKDLEDKGFKKVNKSYLVNLSYVIKIFSKDGNYFALMTNGINIPLGKNITDFSNSYVECIKNK